MTTLFTVAVFALARMAPGDPATNLLRAGGDEPSVEAVAETRARLGLDAGIGRQYVRWVSHAARLDFGRSYSSGRSVRSELGARAPQTAALAVTSALLAIGVGTLAGVLTARAPGGRVDAVTRALVVVGLSVPSFWAGLVLIDIFAVRLGWFPAGAAPGWRGLVLPSLTLGISFGAIHARVARSVAVHALATPYVLSARSKGIPESLVIGRHTLALIGGPLLQSGGLLLGQLLAGSIVVEHLFGVPGLGQMAVEALARRDHPRIQAYLFLAGVTVIVLNTLTDLLHAAVDPRVRSDRAAVLAR